MTGFKYTEKAEADLNNIIDYTLKMWGKQQAYIYIDGLEKLALSLSAVSNIGKTCDDLHAGLWAFPYQKHVLYYLQEPGGITIMRVLHESMNPGLYFGEDDRK